MQEQQTRIQKDQQQLDNHKQKLLTLQHKQKELAQKIQSFDNTQYDADQKHKTTLRSQQQDLLTKVPHAVVRNYRQQYEILQTYLQDDMTLLDLNQALDKIKDAGTFWAKEKKQREERIQELRKHEQREQEQLAQWELKGGTKAYQQLQQTKQRYIQQSQQSVQQLTSQKTLIQEKLASSQDRIVACDDKIKNYLTAIQSESIFHCEKIASDCPYISMINKKTLNEMNKQLDVLKAEKKVLLDELDKAGYESKITQLQKEIASYEQEL